ncbi:MAG TPA: hypothetical protein VKC34_12665 [Blastocatellia bacterium]|nr:hypothetical protein [Blastocatellia bacterium]
MSKNIPSTIPAAMALIAILSLALAPTSFGKGITKRIKFARGRNSAVIGGAVIRGERDRYIVGAREGQKMTVSIKSVEDNAVFQIYFAGEQESLEGAGEADDATTWSGRLPASVDYVIVVGPGRGNASYKLEVKIE